MSDSPLWRSWRAASVALGVAALIPSAARATPWVTNGPRALGMGGAYVAIAEGPVGAYYNPGALGQLIDNPSGLQMPGSGRYELNGTVFEGANDLHQIRRNCPGGSLCTDVFVQQALAKINAKGAGGTAEATGGLHLKFGRLAVFANNFSFRGVTPQVDTVNNTAAAVAANTSRLHIRGGSFYEFGAGYGRELFETGLFLGANMKGIVAKVGYTDFLVVRENPEVGNVLRNYDRSTRVSFQPGVDVGLLWDIRESFPDVWLRPRVGFVGRNINNPRFEQPVRAREIADSRRFSSLQGQSRMGVAISPLRWWHIAADFDLTENLTFVDNYTSRHYSAGTEINLVNETWLNIPLRGGVTKNIAQGNSGTGWSMGFGLHFMHVLFDFAAEVPDRFHQVQSLGASERLPHHMALSAQVALLFGGTEAISEPSRDPFLPTAPPRRLPTRKTPARSPVRDPFRR